MNWADRRERRRSVIAGPRRIYPASVYDAISAPIAEDLGFAARMFATRAKAFLNAGSAGG